MSLMLIPLFLAVRLQASYSTLLSLCFLICITEIHHPPFGQLLAGLLMLGMGLDIAHNRCSTNDSFFYFLFVLLQHFPILLLHGCHQVTAHGIKDKPLTLAFCGPLFNTCLFTAGLHLTWDLSFLQHTVS